MRATLLPTEYAARLDLLRPVAMQLLTNRRGATSSFRMFLLFVAFAVNGYPREPWLLDALVHVASIVRGVVNSGRTNFAMGCEELAARINRNDEHALAVLRDALLWSAREQPDALSTVDAVRSEPSA